MAAADVVVIGGGIGGLSAAIRLAGCGRHVVLLERGARLGGKMAEVSEAGFRFDIGPSVITMRPVFTQLFASAGRRLEDYLTLLPIDPLTRYFYPDGTQLDIRRGLPETLAGIGAIAPGDIPGYLGFLSHAAYLHHVTAPVFTYGPPPTPYSLLRVPPLDALRVGRDVLHSLDGLIAAHVQHPHLRQLLGRFTTYVGSSPYQASGVLGVIAHVELNEGVWYPRGGIYQIALAYEQLARELGVEIRTGCEARRIVTLPEGGRGRRVSGVEADGGLIPARAVIANLDAAAVYERLLDVPPRAMAARLERLPLSCSGFVLLLGVEGQDPRLAHHNIFFSSDSRREFAQIFNEQLPPDDPTIYVAITARTDARHAPPGCDNLFVLVNVPPSGPRFDWEAHKGDYTDRVLSRLAGFGFDVRGRTRVQCLLTPLDLERLNGARRGSLYGVSFNNRLAPFLRHGNRAVGIRGLYFAGGTVHPGGGVPMVTLSGKVAAEMLLEDE